MGCLMCENDAIPGKLLCEKHLIRNNKKISNRPIYTGDYKRTITPYIR